MTGVGFRGIFFPEFGSLPLAIVLPLDPGGLPRLALPAVGRLAIRVVTTVMRKISQVYCWLEVCFQHRKSLFSNCPKGLTMMKCRKFYIILNQM